MNGTRIFRTFGCLVEASPAHRQLDALHPDQVTDLFLQHGLVVFRGFSTTLDTFREFTNQLCADFRPHPNVGQRLPVNADETIVTANQGLGEVWLHGEMYYLPIEERPDVLWFLCREPSSSGGETTFADGVSCLEGLAPETQECFANRKILYPSKRKGSRGGTLTSAVSRTRHDTLAFINSILNRYQHVGGSNTHPHMVRFEDGESIPETVLADVQRATGACEEQWAWRPGDFAMVDNTWIMHGRRAFSGPRDVVTRMGSLRGSSDDRKV